jgi:hypothetical protein
MGNGPGIKTTELWLTTIVGVVDTILVLTSNSDNRAEIIVLVVSLSVVAITYLVCRTVFKISKLKYRPDTPVAFKANDTGGTEYLSSSDFALQQKSASSGQVISEDH